MLNLDMEKVYMRKFFAILVLMLVPSVFATNQMLATTNVVNPVTIPQNIAFENCTKIFAINSEKLYYLTLAAISANNFIIEELQTSDGYIIFSVNNNKYIATIAEVDSNNSILKITPCNNIYNFPPGIIINIFKYIDINLNVIIK